MSDPTAWRRSSRCNNGQCLLVARTEQHVLLRDSKDPSGRTLALTVEEFGAFLAAVKAGKFDGTLDPSASVASSAPPASPLNA